MCLIDLLQMEPEILNVLPSQKMVFYLVLVKDVTARIDERSDKSYATQVYYCQTIGATRMEEAKVISVLAN